jgi:integrase
MKHAFQSRLILENPLDYLTDIERKELFSESDRSKQPAVLSVEDSRRLIQGAYERIELELLPVITLGLFCGLRTNEIQRLDWKDIHLDSSRPFISIHADVAKKRSIRNVDISPNAVEWLSLCQKQSGEVIPNPYMAYLYRRLHKLLKHIGMGEKDETGAIQTSWGNNLMRHSFATYHYALHGDATETTRQLGHDGGLQMLFKHYRALATKKDGERYFAIKPAASAAKVVEFTG